MTSADDSLRANRGRSIVGSVAAHGAERGWFFGHFMEAPLLRSELVEVAWQKRPNVTPSTDQRHLHRASVEINVVVAGSVSLKIDEVAYTLMKGDFFVVWPETTVSEIATDADAEVLVVRAPSIDGDKFMLVDERERHP